MANSQLTSLAAVNEVVSGLVVGVGGSQNFVAEQALPVVDAGSENFTYRTAANEALLDHGTDETLRGVGADPNRISLAFSTGTGILDEHMLEAKIDYREIEAATEKGGQNAINLRLRYAATLRDNIQIGKEKAVADVVFAAGNYSGRTASNVNFGTDTDIRDKVIAQKDARAQASGFVPNTLLVGQITHRMLLKNPAILDAIKYSRGGITTAQLIAEFLEVDQYLVGTAVSQAKAAPGAAGAATSIWTGDVAALYYVNRGLSDSNNPSFGYLFTKNYDETGGRAIVKTWQQGIFEHMVYGERFKPYATFTASGYLWTNTDQV
jgi:hypothetical protein